MHFFFHKKKYQKFQIFFKRGVRKVMSGYVAIIPKVHCPCGPDGEGGGLWRHLTEVRTYPEVPILKK